MNIEDISKEKNKDKIIKDSISKCKSIENLNAFELIMENYKLSDTDNILCNVPYGLKDNFSTKGILTTGSSNTLKDYVPIFNSTVYEKLNKCGAVMVAKTSMDEFGMGGTGTTGHKGITHNPYDYDRIAGGSSSGSAVSVASGCFPFALGTDTGDSIRKPAAYCGIVGYKPTYGMISRYGVFPFACSLDTVGVLTRNVKDAAIVVDNIKGIDSKDMTTFDSSNINLSNNIDKDVKGKKLFYIKELCDIENYENPSEELKEHLNIFKETIKKCEKLGMIVNKVSIDKKLLNALPSVYVVISCAEATSNMSNLTGISFGPRGEGNNYIDMMKDHRTKGFSSLIKRRFVIGSYVLQKENQEKYFLNAKRVRGLITSKMNELFKEYDALIMPVGSGKAPYIENSKNIISKNTSVLEEHLQIANYGGLPSITIPCGFIDDMPVGVNITGKVKDDENILNISYKLEEEIKFKDMIRKVK